MLNGLGCDLPATLMEADAYNAEGYWESTEVVALNEAVLASAGSTWDDWEPFNPDWHASPVAEGFRSRARAVIESEFGDSPLFVVKDPRVCRLLDFWIDALADCGVDARIAVPIRNPLEVAASLEARDTIDPSVGLLLWLRHVLDAERACRAHPRAFVRFESLLDSWQPLADAMGEAFGVAWPKRSTTAGLEIESHLPPTGRHHVRDDASLPKSADVSRWVAETFEIVDRWTRADVRETDTGRLDAVGSAFDEAAAVFGRAVATGMRAGQRNRVLEREVTALNDVVADREGQIDSLNRAVADRDENVGYLNDLVAKKDGQITSLDAVVEDRDGRIDSLGGDVAERDGQIESLNGAVADRDGQIDALHEVIERRDEELAGVYASYSWSLTKPLRVVKHALLTGPGVIGRGISRGGRHALALVWRLTPLPKSWRDGLKRAGRQTLPALAPPAGPAVHRTASTYVHSGWLDLADRNYEARRNGSGVAILFDPDWYCTTYPDIPAAEIDPLTHYVEHGAVEGRWPIELDPAEVDPTIQALHRLDLASEGAEAFDAGFCRVLYPELAPLNDDELALVCRSESRTDSKAAFLRGICENPREIPLDFNATEYIRLYPDLRWLTDQSSLEVLRHYMCHGRFEPRLHTLRTDSMDATSEAVSVSELGAGSNEAARPLCVLAHVYYPELWDELAGYLGNLPPDLYDLYVNLVDDTFDRGLLARIREAFPAARVYVSENLGRDIGGHFQLLRNLRMEDYRLFCLVHTKKSPHMGEGEVQRWRRKLLVPLMGSPECAAENIQAMLEDETIGQIGSERCRYTEMNANREKYNALLERMEIASDSADVEFLSGTMMFLRADVLRRVFDAAGDLVFERSDEGAVEGDPDGAWAHAVERVFGAVVRDLNYRLEWR